WWQEQRDQHAIVRNYVKWDYELRRNETIHRVVPRALQLAATEPCGVAYLTLPRELLMEKMAQVTLPKVARHGPAVTPQGDAGALERAGGWLVEARSPLILAGQVGRHPEAVPLVVALAEALAAPVIDSRYRLNFPSNHPLHLGYSPSPYLEQADVILLLDLDVPYLPALQRPAEDARIISIDIDPVKEDYVTWEFPVDLALEADTRKALPALLDAVQRQLTTEHRSGIEERRARLRNEHESQRAAWERGARGRAEDRPIAVEWLAHCLNRVLRPEDIFLSEAVTNAGAFYRLVERTEPGSFLHSGGSSLGWALGAALGAKLAHPERRVVTVVGDGAFIFGHPVPALWASQVYQAPFLTVVLNNGEYFASKRPIVQAYPEGYSARTDLWLGTQFAPSPCYALVAQGAHAYAETVTDPAEVEPALRRALAQVESGTAAVLDIVLSTP
ncbi:MAG: thiamine pyrophosphate-requiring protein, partial [Chloroflexi bacterium]|nr:thiamine pyrophosphate-requiring protein [Chloroflexota bacterium]